MSLFLVSIECADFDTITFDCQEDEMLDSFVDNEYPISEDIVKTLVEEGSANGENINGNAIYITAVPADQEQ
jgi:hypothetical protein